MTYYKKIYFLNHNNIYEYSEGSNPKIIANNKSGVLGMALKDGYVLVISF